MMDKTCKEYVLIVFELNIDEYFRYVQVLQWNKRHLLIFVYGGFSSWHVVTS